MANSTMKRYQFQLLQYMPNLVSGEHVNIAVFLYDQSGSLLDARFAGDFQRLRCHPLADLPYLEALRNEFEEWRLLGEGFSAYGQKLQRDLAAALRVSEQRMFWGGEPEAEIERLYRSYVATPRGEKESVAEAQAGTRRALRRHMEETFRRYHLFANGGRPARDVNISYGTGRLQFKFDYRYVPDEIQHYVHGIALRNDVRDASKLCFVVERLRARQQQPAVTAVVDDQMPRDTIDLLEETGVAAWQASKLDELALAIRGDLCL